MKFHHLKRRCWYIIGRKPRPLADYNNHYVLAPLSSEHPHCVKFFHWLIEPMRINKELIEHSNLWNMNDEKENAYDSLKLKYKTIPFPFVIRFNYGAYEPCEITFPQGEKMTFKYIHRLQQFIYAVTGEEMRIRMHF